MARSRRRRPCDQLATAHVLMRRGFQMTVLERWPIPNPIASSYERHRLIRPHFADRPVYARRTIPMICSSLNRLLRILRLLGDGS